MEKLHVVAVGLLLLSAGFLIASIILPDWIIMDAGVSVGGPTRIGLVQACIKVMERGYQCYLPAMNGPWIITVILLFSTLLCLICASVFLVAAFWNRPFARHGKLLVFTALTTICIAGILYPASFGDREIGGAPYQLPQDCRIGIGYVLFVAAQWTIVCSEICAGRFCVFIRF